MPEVLTNDRAVASAIFSPGGPLGHAATAAYANWGLLHLARIWLTIGVMIIGFQGSEADTRAAFSRALDIDATVELER